MSIRVKSLIIIINIIFFTSIVSNNYANKFKCIDNNINVSVFIDTVQPAQYTVLQLHEITKKAIMLSNSEVDSIRSKGYIILDIIAKYLQDEYEKGNLDYKDTATHELLLTLEKKSYYIVQHKVPRIIKLAYYLCKGKYRYIYSRAKHEWYFWGANTLLSIILLFYILSFSKNNFFGKRRSFIRAVNYIFIILLIAFLIFKFTCDKNITNNCFYGFIYSSPSTFPLLAQVYSRL